MFDWCAPERLSLYFHRTERKHIYTIKQYFPFSSVQIKDKVPQWEFEKVGTNRDADWGEGGRRLGGGAKDMGRSGTYDMQMNYCGAYGGGVFQ